MGAGKDEIRASDRDRETAVSLLQDHCAAGRLDLDELGERVAGAYGARTVGELKELVRDLPDAPAAVVPRPQAGGGGRVPRMPGLRPFTETLEAPRARSQVLTEALTRISPPLHRYGYELVAHGPDALEFEVAERPMSYTIAGVLLFPFGGFVLLLLKQRSRVRLSLEDLPDGGTRLTAFGSAPLPVRRAFAAMRS